MDNCKQLCSEQFLQPDSVATAMLLAAMATRRLPDCHMTVKFDDLGYLNSNMNGLGFAFYHACMHVYLE